MECKYLDNQDCAALEKGVTGQKGGEKKAYKKMRCIRDDIQKKKIIAKLSHPASIGWVALSSLVRRRLSVRPSRIGNISIYLHYMMF